MHLLLQECYLFFFLVQAANEKLKEGKETEAPSECYNMSKLQPTRCNGS